MNRKSKSMKKKEVKNSNTCSPNTEKSKRKDTSNTLDNDVLKKADIAGDITMPQLDTNLDNFDDINESNSNENSSNNEPKEEGKQLDSAENEETGVYFNTSKAYPHTVLNAFDKPVDLIADSSAVSFLGSAELEEIANAEITVNHSKQRKKELDEYQNKNHNVYQQLKQIYGQKQQKFIPTQLQSSSCQDAAESFFQQSIQNQSYQKQKHNVDRNSNLVPLQLLENSYFEKLLSHSSTSNQRARIKMTEQTITRKNLKNNDKLFYGYAYNKQKNFDEDDSQPTYLNVETFRQMKKENERLHSEVEKWKSKYLELLDDEGSTNLYKLQAESYKEDFERERADREAAMGRLYDVEKKLEKAEEMLSLLHRISNLAPPRPYEN